MRIMFGDKLDPSKKSQQDIISVSPQFQAPHVYRAMCSGAPIILQQNSRFASKQEETFVSTLEAMGKEVLVLPVGSAYVKFEEV